MKNTKIMFSMCIILCRILVIDSTFSTGFWYGGTRGPLAYDSVPYTKCTVKINMPFQDGPGQSLFKDPLNPSASIYVGNTINRQSFDTQFVLDLQYALELSADRIFVTEVTKAAEHFYQESTSVIVYFMLIERNVTTDKLRHANITTDLTLIHAIAKLEALIQTSNSKVFVGTNVTNLLDPLYGLQVVSWDVSLRLMYSIESIGGNSVIDDYYLNYGGLGFCDQVNMALLYEMYCEFERFFEDDVSRALDIAYYRIQILFIKKSALDSVLIFFRILPPSGSGYDVSTAIANLIVQAGNQSSVLYTGNVTIRTDPAWGVSGESKVKRKLSALFTQKHYDYDPRHMSTDLVASYRRPHTFVTPYVRCKANHRCNWGSFIHNQSTNEVNYYQQLFTHGQLFPVQLYLDFEDWRTGSRGLLQDGAIPPTANNKGIPEAHSKATTTIRGAHFWPFATPHLGPDIPAYLLERNQGLVFDRRFQHFQIGLQEALVHDLEGRLQWIDENIEWAVMDAKLRARKDVRRHMSHERESYRHWLLNEQQELHELNSSQCALVDCVIHFDTTTLEVTGAMTDKGVVMKTSRGTEVAVFNFNSIRLGPEVRVVLTGQRAIALVSRSSVIINCTIKATPGTLGGFRGGYSASRLYNDTLSDSPRDILMCDFGGYCINDTSVTPLTAAQRKSLQAYNVNGPGSGNVLIYPLIIKTSAPHIPEVQVVTTTAQAGQTLSGGFTLQYGAHISPLIPFDASAGLIKTLLEENLNVDTPADFPISVNRYTEGVAGIGIVNITRSRQDNQTGYSWTITFTTAVGNIAQLRPVSYLSSLHANVQVTTLQDGNEVTGNFTVNFRGHRTLPISAKDSALDVKSKLLLLPDVSTVFVDRIDPTGNCGDGLCENSPLFSDGMVWTVYVGLNSSCNVSPTSPAEALSYHNDFNYPHFTADSSNIHGIGAKAEVIVGLSGSRGDMYSLLQVSKPFSLAFGGAGGSYGGAGGAGYGESPTGSLYGDETIPDLLGGSGGTLRGQHPFDSNAFLTTVAGRGGHGGGAIEVVAAVDIVMGSYGVIDVCGGDAEQTSEGGGGGGSGGSIVLAAGGNVLVERPGALLARGGLGGYGGNAPVLSQQQLVSQAGGGGGGGRIAIYGQSISLLSGAHATDVSGGACGALKLQSNVTYNMVNISVNCWTKGYLDDQRLRYLAEVFLNGTFHPIAIYYQSQSPHSTKGSSFNDRPTLIFLIAMNLSIPLKIIEDAAYKADGMSIGDVVMSNVTIVSNYTDKIIVPTIDFKSAKCRNSGSNGTVYTEALINSDIYISDNAGLGAGAEQTDRALFISNNEVAETASGILTEAPFPWNGPIISFAPGKPTRVTFYVKLDSVPVESLKAQFSALFTLISRGESDLNLTSVIGVSVGDRIKHGSNFALTPDEFFYLDRLASIEDYATLNTWYKVDIHLRWDLLTYNILLNDVLVSQGTSFRASQIDGIRLSVYRALHVWFDEIYVGFDTMMRFQCPITTRKGTSTVAPEQRGWRASEVDSLGSSGFDEIDPMKRHYNFLSDVGNVHFDGQGMHRVREDIIGKTPDGDYLIGPAKLHAGALKYLKGTPRSARLPDTNVANDVSSIGLWAFGKPGVTAAGDGRYFWYIEHTHNESANRPPAAVDLGSYLNGGIGSCSTQDLKSWRFEGITLHYYNLSDMVFGSNGPFSLERPSVIFNNETRNYVMYATMNDPNHELGLSVVATSPFEDGPFLFRRSMYPDGNKTRDQIAFVNDEHRAVLGRTYYATVEYLMPEAVMQPVWESVKFKNGSVYYSLNYHRAFYDIGYDNFHDIYLQRWRLEDKPWEVYCVDRVTKVRRFVPYDTFILNEDTKVFDTANNGTDVCNNPNEYKIVVGQGNPLIKGYPFIKTRFITPNQSDNSWWVQTSVPAVQAQPWANNYEDGFCGIRKLDDDHDVLDPALEQFQPTPRGDCSNIDDNPVHQALEDKLIGVMRVVTSRRAKYIAVSELTSDFLDTTGVMKSVEGQLDSGNLISLITGKGQFGFGPGDALATTFLTPVRSEYNTANDYKIRFQQYISTYNDRSQFALACVLDNVCSVNYTAQLRNGQI